MSKSDISFQLNGCLSSVCSVPFPYMVLLASGGHCILGIVEDVDKFYRLGETKDIAPGEAFDKVSKKYSLRFSQFLRNIFYFGYRLHGQ